MFLYKCGLVKSYKGRLVMGYALFANRKLFYTHLVHQLQTELDMVTRKKMNLLTYSANLSDGRVTYDEMASDADNYYLYKDFLATCDARNTTDEAYQSVFNEILTGAANAGCSQEDLELFKASIADSANLKYSQELTKKLEVQEEQLDLQQQKIQTELSVAQSQLEAVQQAEGQAIKNATPKYNGVG